jgi:hypothetical protein
MGVAEPSRRGVAFRVLAPRHVGACNCLQVWRSERCDARGPRVGSTRRALKNSTRRCRYRGWGLKGISSRNVLNTRWALGVASLQTPTPAPVLRRRYPRELERGMQRPSGSAPRRPFVHYVSDLLFAKRRPCYLRGVSQITNHFSPLTSLSRVAAVDSQHLTCNVRRLIRSQEQRGMSHINRLARPAQRQKRSCQIVN